MIKLNPDEKIHLIRRRHRIVLTTKLLPEIFIISVLILAIVFVSLFPKISWPEFLIKYFPNLLSLNLRFLILFFISSFLSIVWVAIFLTITNYYLDCWIVTNQRSIHAELKSLFNYSFSSIPHDRIQDISISIKGILPSIFRFGDLQIQTAGEAGQFIFYQVPEPEIVKQVIFEAQSDFLKKMKKDGIL